MRVLLDNCVPRPLETLLPGLEVTHYTRHGWERLGNGRLLSAAEEAAFAVMITADKNIESQQNMTRRSITVIYLRAPNNKVEVLEEMVPLILQALTELQLGKVVTLDHPNWR